MIHYDKRSLIITGILSLIAAYVANRVCEALQSVPSTGLLPSMEDVGGALLATLVSAPFHIHATDVGLLALGLGGAAVWLIYFYRMTNNQYRRPGEEHGSSRWGTKKDIQPFTNPDPDRNIILSQTEHLNIDEFVKDPKYSRNKNVVIIGGSGTGNYGGIRIMLRNGLPPLVTAVRQPHPFA